MGLFDLSVLSGEAYGLSPDTYARAWGVVHPARAGMKVGWLALRDPDSAKVVNFPFHNGGFGRGHIPFARYVVSHGVLRNDNPRMMVDGFGYSFHLTQMGRPLGTALDPRYQTERDELRIHPDGGEPGTLGCIGIVGDRALQERFFLLGQRLLEAHGEAFEFEFLPIPI